MSANKFSIQNNYDLDDIGEVYSGDDTTNYEQLYKQQQNMLAEAIDVIKWYAKHGYADFTDLRGMAQEFLNKKRIK